MYLSDLFIPITKDLPTEAKIKSHQLMLRAGMIKQSSAGIYSLSARSGTFTKEWALARLERHLGPPI